MASSLLQDIVINRFDVSPKMISFTWKLRWNRLSGCRRGCPRFCLKWSPLLFIFKPDWGSEKLETSQQEEHAAPKNSVFLELSLTVVSLRHEGENTSCWDNMQVNKRVWKNCRQVSEWWPPCLKYRVNSVRNHQTHHDPSDYCFWWKLKFELSHRYVYIMPFSILGIFLKLETSWMMQKNWFMHLST